MKTPATLLERLRRPGDAEAWTRFVELYTPLLYHWCRRIGLRHQDAQDLVQDVLAHLLRKLPELTYDPERSFRSWLRTVTLNKWRESLRRAAPAPEGSAALAEAACPDQAEELWDAEHHRHLARRALEVMKADFHPTTWKACWEYVACGRPAAEVAAELGISVGAVHAARLRVLARLRHELAGLLD
jgi:RNA polymerase sigma-70 factor (ECF subfamily)